MNFSVEPMAERHIPSLARLEKECFSQPWSEEALLNELKNPNARFLAAVCGETVLGYIGVHEICGEAYIANIAIFEKHRRSGVGRALLKAACDAAGVRGCEFITLEVRASNLAAIGLYESAGFCLAGMRKNFYSSPAENALIYTKFFNHEVSK